MCARSTLLNAPMWAAAPRTHLDKLLQRVQNKFLRIALNASCNTRIEGIHKMAEIELIDEIMSRMLPGA